jgi:hypothetical protein
MAFAFLMVGIVAHRLLPKAAGALSLLYAQARLSDIGRTPEAKAGNT